MGFEILRNLLKDKIHRDREPHPEKAAILIIDDDRHLLEDLAFALKDDYQVLGRESGMDGVEILDETISAVILDIKMPGQDGFDIFRKIKERFLHLPVIFHSAYQDLKDPYEIINEYRPFGYVSKSADLAQLRDAINSAVNYYQQIRRNRELLRELQLTKNYLDNIINSMPSVLVGLDPEKHVIHWNRMAEEATGVKAADAIGKPVESVFPELGAQMAAVGRAISEKRPHKTEKLVKQENGKIRYADVLCYPLVTNGIDGVVLRIDDVTEHILLEEMMVKAEKMTTISGLAAGIAHEINNPLSIILQSIQVAKYRLAAFNEASKTIARKYDLDLESLHAFLREVRVLHHFDHIENAGLRASEIVRTMLNFSRKCDSQKAPTDIHRLIEEMIHLAANEYDLKKKYSFRSIEIIRRYAPEMPEIPCLRVEIGQVLLNLLRNAAQAIYASAPALEPRITITTGVEEHQAFIAVADNGPGMDPDIKSRVFEPFFTTKVEGQGTGLGLSVSHHIIQEHHNGSLSVVSEKGAGATFTIRLPVKGV